MLNYAECLGKPMEALPDMKEEAKNRNVGKQFRKIEKKKAGSSYKLSLKPFPGNLSGK